MQQIEEQADAPQAMTSVSIWNAAAINLVLVLALLTAGMVFAVDLAMAAAVALGLSVLFWGCAALVLLLVWLASLGGRLLQHDAPADSLQDPWLDE